jgi:hypothetical protein
MPAMITNTLCQPNQDIVLQAIPETCGDGAPNSYPWLGNTVVADHRMGFLLRIIDLRASHAMYLSGETLRPAKATCFQQASKGATLDDLELGSDKYMLADEAACLPDATIAYTQMQAQPVMVFLHQLLSSPIIYVQSVL